MKHRTVKIKIGDQFFSVNVGWTIGEAEEQIKVCRCIKRGCIITQYGCMLSKDDIIHRNMKDLEFVDCWETKAVFSPQVTNSLSETQSVGSLNSVSASVGGHYLSDIRNYDVYVKFVVERISAVSKAISACMPKFPHELDASEGDSTNALTDGEQEVGSVREVVRESGDSFRRNSGPFGFSIC